MICDASFLCGLVKPTSIAIKPVARDEFVNAKTRERQTRLSLPCFSPQSARAQQGQRLSQVFVLDALGRLPRFVQRRRVRGGDLE